MRLLSAIGKLSSLTLFDNRWFFVCPDIYLFFLLKTQIKQQNSHHDQSADGRANLHVVQHMTCDSVRLS
jgi:hypothetical protein